ncbi:MAG TPA: pyrroloquinoline quinone-dependent dehydrogenase [Steroidobacteraceae bacterium]|nr:pyrroloquinoline quinone-dependent dehydrogenase [Steroidobacteraceae bacterium]
MQRMKLLDSILHLASRISILFLSALRVFAADSDTDDLSQWSWYGGDPGGSRYADIGQITRENVANLEIAWQYRTGELGEGFKRVDKMAFEATPILVEGSLYLSTPTDIVIALDPTSGKERWRYDPHIARGVSYSEATSRGVSFWLDRRARSAQVCSLRIFIGTLDARLIALDGRTGKPCSDFGHDGTIELNQGARVLVKGEYLVTSPPTVYGDTVITGSAIGDNRAVSMPRGVVRAFDVRTGTLRWNFDPIPIDATQSSKRGWQASQAQITGAANAWSAMSVDPARGLVYVPTGSASPDFFGGARSGDNAYANSLVALRASDGSVAWSRQFVHHDLWDYDLAAQPVLADLDREGKSIAAIVQATKMGTVFVLDRETGEPINEIIERPVPMSKVPGEVSSPTQPFTTTPPLTSHAAVTPEDAWGLTFYDRQRCRELIRSLKSDGLFTPPSTEATIESPGYAGGVNWGSVAYDSERQVIVAAVNHLPMVVQLVPRDQKATTTLATSLLTERAPQDGTPYRLQRGPLLSPFGLPCTAPPWGTLAALDLQHNTLLWQIPLGSTKDFTPWFIPAREIGMPNMGGPIVTASGLIFVAAATDNYLRAFDIETGRELWKGRLPAGGQATPMTYEISGRQYIVIAAGGHGSLGTTRGDYVVAFALSQKK